MKIVHTLAVCLSRVLFNFQLLVDISSSDMLRFVFLAFNFWSSEFELAF